MLFTAGKKIGRYEILSLLGSGGMSEVYLAKDTHLQRRVALKFLKKTNDREQLRRFGQEAKAASSLNHPNILSVYEFDEFEGHHYLVTEFIKGKTLREIISQKNLTVKKAVEIAVQIGNTLIVAHEAGIIHRDIKPENIIVLPDGYVKVLDFGLAKLISVDKVFADVNQESTVSLLQTSPGLIIGTVHYMSPEQIRGQSVDERTDIWSLGIVFFEMIAGYRPFEGETVGDVIAAILERPLPSVPDIQPEIKEIFVNSLAKAKEDRYLSAKEMVTDLRRLNESLKTDTISQSFNINNSAARQSRAFVNSFYHSFSDTFFQNAKNRLLLFSLIMSLTLAGIGIWYYYFRASTTTISPKNRKTKSLTTSGGILNAVLSPDGTVYAFAQETADGKQSLKIRQISGNGESVLIPPSNVSYNGIQFSPDKNSIFYTVFEDKPFGILYRIPTIGGSSQKITENVDSAVAFSPDGKRFAFIRSSSHEGLDQIIVSNNDGSGQSILSERKYPERYLISDDVREGLAWSHDGNTIACAAGTQDESGERMTVVEIDLETRVEKKITQLSWFRVGKVLWTKEGRDLIITAAEPGASAYQILRIGRADGELKERITSELNDYLNISFSEDSRFLLAIADSRSSALSVASGKTPTETSEIAAGNLQGLGGLTWTNDGKILYTSGENGNRDIWRIDADGKNPFPLTTDPAADEFPSISSDDKQIAFISSRTGIPHVWMMKSDGSDPKILTNKGGESFPQISPDGNSVYYVAEPLKVWQVQTTGGNSSPLLQIPANWLAISPDGTKIAAVPLIGGDFKLSIFNIGDGKEIQSFNFTGSIGNPRFPPWLRWTPDGQAVGYISTENGVSNIRVQKLSGGEPKKLTNFPVDRIFAFDWSKDGSKIAFARGKADNKLILFEDF